jgi:seryl-tRNA synthetase
MFESRKELFSKIEAQAAEITRLETELTAALTKGNDAAESSQEVAGLREDLQAATEENASLSAQLEKVKADHAAELAAEKAKTAPEAIQALVTAEIAGSGHPPLAIENENGKDDSAVLKSEFDRMTPAAKMEFFRKGGKVKDN